jgi:ankyrin repeat protein
MEPMSQVFVDADRSLLSVQVNSGGTALTCAIRGGHAWIVHSLLSMGAPPDGVSPGQITPLMIATQLGNVSIVRHLLDKGANVDLQVTETG